MRIQIELDEQGVSIVNRVRSMTGISTYKDLFNNAITLLDWAARQSYKGLAIAAADEEKQQYRELEMPALRCAAAAGQAYRALLQQQTETARSESTEAKAG